jgi:hypothetical protein
MEWYSNKKKLRVTDEHSKCSKRGVKEARAQNYMICNFTYAVIELANVITVDKNQKQCLPLRVGGLIGRGYNRASWVVYVCIY